MNHDEEEERQRQAIPSGAGQLHALGIRATSANCGACTGCHLGSECRFAEAPDIAAVGGTLILGKNVTVKTGEIVWRPRLSLAHRRSCAWVRGRDHFLRPETGPMRFVWNVPRIAGEEHTPGVDIARANSVWAVVSSRIERGETCWSWTGAMGSSGYPTYLDASGQAHPVHRIAVAAAGRASLPPGWLVRHLCGNTRCLRPSHLKCGTAGDNADDEIAYGRVPALLSFEDVWEVFYMSHFMPRRDIAGIFGIPEKRVNDIADGRRLRDVVEARPWKL